METLPVRFSHVEDKIITLREEQVILDSDVARLYNVATKEINQAVRNNPLKFPAVYVFELGDLELISLRSKILTLKKSARGQHVKYTPKAFTERGLYMLATILKGEQAIRTTIEIIETFAKMRELTRTITALSTMSESPKQAVLVERSGNLIADLLEEAGLETTGTETSFEVNLPMLKFKHTVHKGKKSDNHK